ncbi:MAG: insulinase family protein [Alphaproteobacteria bacterium]|nr:insulinase family protein [Alphaproteobacteria bacterium]
MRPLPIRQTLFVLLCLAVASCTQVGSTPTTSAPASTSRPDYTYWPQEVSDLKPDAAVRYGVLSNGMRYAIMRNTQPAGTISLRLRVASGSLQERDEQRGLAHFMEHMAFNGSKNVPEGEYVKLLQRKGLAFGAHTNAYTSTNETVYMLELPKNDADLVDTGLMLFREIGDRLTLDPAAIEREKGVVLSELRTRNTPEYRAYEQRWRLWYEGQRQANRMPIGTLETIQGATKDLLSDYYRRFYRPERTLLIAVGDFDPADLEAKVKAKFADWKGEGEPSTDPAQGLPKERGLVAKSHTDANLPEDVTVSWFQPPSNATDSTDERTRDAVAGIAFTVVNRRLGRLARADKAPFVGASLGQSETRDLSKMVSLSVSSRPGQWQKAMGAAEQELRRALEHGFAQSEVDREVKEWRASLEDNLSKVATRNTSGLANEMASSFEARMVFTHPRDDLAVFERYLPKLTAADAQAALKEAVRGAGPVVFVASGQKVEGGDTAVLAAFEQSQKTVVAAPDSIQAKSFPYADFGKPGQVADRKQIDDLGVTLVRFANGVKLNIKPTTFEKDTIYVSTRFDGGYIHMPRNKIGLNFAMPFGFIEGGLKKLTTDELEETLAGRIVSTDLDIDEEAFEFSGRTNVRDLSLQMQLMAAYATDPAYRTSGIERLQSAAENFLKQYSSSPSRVLSRETQILLRSGDTRWAFPTLAQIKALKIDDVSAVLKPSLNTAPVEISIVGDVNVEDAIAAVGATFGALEPRADKLSESPGARKVVFPANPHPVRFTHEGRPDQASAYVAWAGPDFYSNPRRARTIALLREMMKVRMTDEFREAQGATYSPSVGSSNSNALPDFGYIVATAETKPELVEGFYTTLDKIVAELKSGSFTDDLIARARTPMLKTAETDRVANGFWVRIAGGLQTEPRSLAAIRSQLDDLKGITRDELVAAANQYLDPKRRLEIRVLPKAAKTAQSTKSTKSSSSNSTQP